MRHEFFTRVPSDAPNDMKCTIIRGRARAKEPEEEVRRVAACAGSGAAPKTAAAPTAIGPEHDFVTGHVPNSANLMAHAQFLC